MMLLNGDYTLDPFEYRTNTAGVARLNRLNPFPRILNRFLDIDQGIGPYNVSKATSISPHNTGTITDIDLTNLQRQVVQMAMREEEFQFFQLIEKKFKQVSPQVMDVSVKEDTNQNNHAEVRIVVCMPQYDRKVMKQLISAEIELDKIAWKRNYELSFSYAPHIVNHV